MADDAVPAPKITENEPEEVAPFAQRLEKSPDIEDLTNPEIKEVRLENGGFNDKGEFIPDGTYTLTESGNPLAKSRTFKQYPDGRKKLAANFDELCAQVARYKGLKKLGKYEQGLLKDIIDRNPDVSIQDISEIITDFEKGFIRAEVTGYNDFVQNGSYTACKDKGVTRLEGKDYVMQDGDIVHFRFAV